MTAGVSPAVIAEACGMTRAAIYRLVQAGVLPAARNADGRGRGRVGSLLIDPSTAAEVLAARLNSEEE
jgi:hypothetical protein